MRPTLMVILPMVVFVLVVWDAVEILRPAHRRHDGRLFSITLAALITTLVLLFMLRR